MCHCVVVIVLGCLSAAMLQCYCASVLQYYCDAVQLYYCAAVLMSCRITVLQCYLATAVLLCSSFTMLQIYEVSYILTYRTTTRGPSGPQGSQNRGSKILGYCQVTGTGTGPGPGDWDWGLGLGTGDWELGIGNRKLGKGMGKWATTTPQLLTMTQCSDNKVHLVNTYVLVWSPVTRWTATMTTRGSPTPTWSRRRLSTTHNF